MDGGRQSGQVMVLVAVAMVALVGSAALILLAGSVMWQRDQLQEIADATAMDAALRIAVGCNATKANAVITEADNFLALRRTRTGSLSVVAGTCATPYVGTDTFAGGLSATYRYPFKSQQRDIEVTLTLSVPVAFGAFMGAPNGTVVKRSLAQAPPASVPAMSAGSINCSANSQVNVQGSIATTNLVVRAGTCALYSHARFDAASGTYSDLGNITVGADGQTWLGAGGACVAGSQVAGTNSICADGNESSGTVAPTCGVTLVTRFLSAADAALNPDPCAAGVGPRPAPARPAGLGPEPNLDPKAVLTLVGTGGSACSAGAGYPAIMVGGNQVGTGLGPVPVKDGAGWYHFKPSCYGYLDISFLPNGQGVFDPGFYYFNASGSGGKGGVCLEDAAQLLGRDVTMELVNTAVFSTATDCGPKGKGKGTKKGGEGPGNGTFGATPCSSTSCPPNVPPDGVNLTWLAAPCAVSPAAADAASCAGTSLADGTQLQGSSWCPVGDRACWNLLVWTPAGVTGTVNLDDTGASAWLLGTVVWSGNCNYGPSVASAIAGALRCDGTLNLLANTSPQAPIGGDAGINTALAEALIAE